jgi:hypothetical protein
MYLSHKYKFLVLRTPKTGSSSLSEFLIKNIDDPDAIYTEIDDTGIPGTLDEAIVNRNRPFKYFHFSLNDLIREKVITPDIIKNYRCISVLRNPVDRQKSFYYFMKKWWAPNTVATLEEYKSFSPDGYSLRREYNTMLKQTDLLMYEGRLHGEFWLYQNLDEHLMDFMNDIGVAIKHPMPTHKSGFRKDREAEIQFDDQVMNSLRNHFKLDFEVYEKMMNKLEK